MPSATASAQLAAVVRKSVLYTLRNRRHTILEVVWPLYFVFILAAAIMPALKSPTASPPACTGAVGNDTCATALPDYDHQFVGGGCLRAVLD